MIEPLEQIESHPSVQISAFSESNAVRYEYAIEIYQIARPTGHMFRQAKTMTMLYIRISLPII